MAVLEDGDSVSEAFGLIEVVGGQHDRGAEGPEVLDHLPATSACFGIEAGGRLIEEDQLGVTSEREREVEAAPLSPREATYDRVVVVTEFDDREQLLERAWPYVEAAPRFDELADSQVQRKPALLEHDTGSLPEFRGMAGGVEAEDTYGPGIGLAEAFEDLHGRGLARPVWSEQTEHLTTNNGEIHALEHRPFAVALVQARDLDRQPGDIHVTKIHICIQVSRVYSVGMAVEKLTPERRRQQTRDVLIAAATEVFARRGFEGAALEEIAETAGFTRGAIYKNFADKEDLFFAVNDRLNEQVIDAFRSIAAESASPSDWDIARLAELWRASVGGEFEDLFAIGKEYELYVLRNPDARPRAVTHRRKQRQLVAAFIEEVAEQSGMTLRFPAATLAAIILAAADGLTYTTRIDGDDLFAPFLELLNAGMIAD